MNWNRFKRYSIVDRIRKYCFIFFSYVISLGVIVTSNACWWYDEKVGISNYEAIYRFVPWLILIIIVLFLFKSPIRTSAFNRYKVIGVILCIFAYRYFDSYADGKALYTLLYVFCFITITLYLLFLQDSEIFWSAFIDVTVVVAVFSLFFYVGGTCLKIIPPLNTTNVNWGYWGIGAKNYYYLAYEAHKLWVGHEETSFIFRNTGFFTEGPMFNYVLCIGLGAEILLVRRKRRGKLFRIVVLIITIFTTFTTTGQLYLAVLLVSYLFKRFSQTPFFQKNRRVFCCVAGVVLIAVVGGLLWTKLFTASGESSTSVRFDHMRTCFNIWRTRKFYGVGFGNSRAIRNAAFYDQGLSVGLPYMLASGGILLITTVFLPFFYNTVKAVKKHTYNNLVFEVLFLMISFLTITFERPLFVLVLAHMVTIDFNCVSDKTESTALVPEKQSIIKYNLVSIFSLLLCIATFSVYLVSVSKSNIIMNMETGFVTKQEIVDSGLSGSDTEEEQVISKTFYYDPLNHEMVKGERNIDGNWYYFDKDSGVMFTGFCEADADGELYPIDKAWDEAVLSENTGLGAYGEEAIKIQETRKIFYYDEQGKKVFGEKAIDGNQYLFEPETGKMHVGFYEYEETDALGNKKRQYYDEYGHRARGFMIIDGDRYYFDYGTGYMITGFKYFEEWDATVCFDSEGRMMHGAHDINGYHYVFDEETGDVLSKKKIR